MDVSSSSSSTSPWPTITPWPSSSPYPTASPTPTVSPWPTQSLVPTQTQSTMPSGAIGRQATFPPSRLVDVLISQFIEPGGDEEGDDAIYNETSSPYPTASPTPTASPWPTYTSWPTFSDFPGLSSHPASSRNGGDATHSNAPSSILELMVDNFINDGNTDQTSSPGPSTTWFPTYSPYPTASPTPTASPWPTQSAVPTIRGSPSGTIDMDSGSGKDAETAAVVTSAGYGQSCSNFASQALARGEEEEELVFAHLAESAVASPDFLTELELRLMDRAASAALQCAAASPSSSGAIAAGIYRIRYPETRAASEATACAPTHPRSEACWLLRTTVLVSTDPSSRTEARNAVLREIQKRLDGGNLMTASFPDLVYTQYLGPDPADEAALLATPQGHSERGTTSPLLYVLIGVGAAAGTMLLIAVSIYVAWNKSRRQQQFTEQQVHDYDNDDGDDDIEIADLLSESRQRARDGAESKRHFVYRDDDADGEGPFRDDDEGSDAPAARSRWPERLVAPSRLATEAEERAMAATGAAAPPRTSSSAARRSRRNSRLDPSSPPSSPGQRASGSRKDSYLSKGPLSASSSSKDSAKTSIASIV